MDTHGDVAWAKFRDGTEIEADAIVGADGIHSAVRASLFGADAPRFTGKICYRSVIPVDAVPGAPVQEGTWLGPHGAIVIYRVRRGELINVVAHHDDDTYTHESWITECDRQEPIERYARWHESLKRLFSASQVWYKWALYDRDPIPQWTRGRVTVLGDAAHPMLPYLGQGACQAMEDGCVLAMALEAMPDDVPGRAAAVRALAAAAGQPGGAGSAGAGRGQSPGVAAGGTEAGRADLGAPAGEPRSWRPRADVDPGVRPGLAERPGDLTAAIIVLVSRELLTRVATGAYRAQTI